MMQRIDSTWMGANGQGRFPFQQPEAPILRLFVDDGPASAPERTEHLRAPLDGIFDAEPTLGEFFESYALPYCLPKAGERNVDQYRESLDLWAKLTGDPPISQIDSQLGARFVAQLAQRKNRKGQPISEQTIRKHLVCVQFCLDRAGPPSRRHSLNAALLAESPYVPKPAVVDDETVECFSLAEIGQILDACRYAGLPRAMRRVAGPTWWRALITVCYNTGLRIGEAMKLRWEWFRDDELGHWARLPKGSTKTKRARDCYFNVAARGAIDSLPRIDDTVFALKIKPRSLQTRRRKLLERTAIPPARHFGFHGFRKALGTELGKMNATAAVLALGHSNKTVTIKSYTHRVVMVESLNALPQPPRQEQPDPQRLLFD